MKISPKFKYIFAAIGFFLPILGLNDILLNISSFLNGIGYFLWLIIIMKTPLLEGVYKPTIGAPPLHLLILVIVSVLVYFISGYLIEKTFRYHISIPIILIIIFAVVNIFAGVLFGMAYFGSTAL